MRDNKDKPQGELQDEPPQCGIRVTFPDDPSYVFVGRWVSWSTSRQQLRKWADETAKELSLPLRDYKPDVIKAAYLVVKNADYTIRQAVREVFPHDPVTKWEQKVAGLVHRLERKLGARKQGANNG